MDLPSSAPKEKIKIKKKRQFENLKIHVNFLNDFVEKKTKNVDNFVLVFKNFALELFIKMFPYKPKSVTKCFGIFFQEYFLERNYFKIMKIAHML